MGVWSWEGGKVWVWSWEGGEGEGVVMGGWGG